MKVIEFLKAKPATTADGRPIPAWAEHWERGEVCTRLQAQRKMVTAGLASESDHAMASALLIDAVTSGWLRLFHRNGEPHYQRPEVDPSAQSQQTPEPEPAVGAQANIQGHTFVRYVRVATVDEHGQVDGSIRLPLQFSVPDYSGPASGYEAFKDEHAVPFDGITPPNRHS